MQCEKDEYDWHLFKRAWDDIKDKPLDPKELDELIISMKKKSIRMKHER